MLSLTGAAPLTFAHGGLSMELDQCKLSIGPYYMHFSGYQKGDRKNTEFCEDMPLVAPTIVVFDFTDNVMRDMEVEILVVPNVDITGDPSRDGAPVFEKPPTRYRNGSIKIGLDFSERGYFVGIVRAIADSGQAWESRFPFSVGYTSWYTGNIKWIVIATVALLGGLVLFRRAR
uniref:Uncharacterized protein n=1 Tax=Haliea sp. ETY-M TaxID=1055105 RepID=A0A455R739_9GAMM|nr:hypothetical protein [Haliea sp. ETY-M]